IRPGTSEVWLGDVGWNNWEEIDRIPSPTDAVVENFGWPCYEGVGRMASYDAANLSMCENLYAAGSGAVATPLFAYSHSSLVVPGESCPTGTSAIAGMAFYPETGGNFPASFRGALFFADYSRNCIWVMFKGSNGLPDPATRQTFVAGAAGPVDLKIGPGGDLFYVDLGGGTVRRIRSTTTGQAPTAVIQATPTSGAAPLSVDFSGTGSSDPEGGPLTYAWDFTTNGSVDSTSPTPTFTYTQQGDYTATLTVTDNQSLSGSTTRLISVTSTANLPPVPTITTPTSSTTWAVDEQIGFSGSAVDPEDGTLAPARLSWSLVLQHCPPTCHPHPQDTFAGVDSGSFIAPNHDYPSHLELTLTATDSQGLSASKTVSLDPRTVQITMASAPAGLELTFAATTQAAPFTVTAIEGSTTTIIARTPQSLGGTNYAFSSWSDNGAQTHSVTAGTANATYTATFTQTASSGYSAAVLASGPAGYWRLGDTGAQAVDSGTNALHGSYVGSPTRGVPGALVGDANTAVDFPALTAAVTVPDNTLLDLGDGPFSYELWFALDETLGTTDQMLINRGTNAPNVALDGPTKRLMLTKGGFGPLFMGSSVIAANSAWHHLVVTRSAAGAGNTKIYLDGVAQTVTAVSPTTTYANNSEVLTFGRKNVGPVERWGGKLDEIAVYRRVLSAGEVTSHYNAGIGP
ncbi:MAG TPA: LamG-like jellyroll fold domain-containing protein, partial [Ilumatobacteraceae bacterium]|nr:LamG-like jellyroll fold domain-containing protein [Ilumatobacteraceae bacterium]